MVKQKTYHGSTEYRCTRVQCRPVSGAAIVDGMLIESVGDNWNSGAANAPGVAEVELWVSGSTVTHSDYITDLVLSPTVVFATLAEAQAEAAKY